jgi:hypothetical protein
MSNPPLGRVVSVTSFRVRFFKNLLSSDGHQFKCLQQTIDVRLARSVDRAVKAAERRFARGHRAPDWNLHADLLEVEVDGKRVDYSRLHTEPGHAKYPSAIYGICH